MEASTYRVLVVDDQETIRDLCMRMLSARGYSVLTAESGADAVELYESHRPDVVLLDLHMPGMDGLATLSAIRALDENARVAMLTSARDEQSVRRALESGARDYILKPFQGRRLQEAIERLLST